MADIFNSNSNTLVSGTSGNDSIYNQYTTNVTINAGAGSDTVYSWGGQKGTIDGGTGNDYIHIGHWIITDDNWFYGSENLLKGGAGNDSIRNWGASATVNGGSGNDSLLNYGEYSTIIGGKGNDTIYNTWDFDNYAWNSIFQYASGDGNDIIYGFKADSTLSISGSSYSTTKSGDNVIVTVGDGKISLIGAATLSKVNIKFKKTSSKISIPAGAYTYNGHSYYVFDNSLTWSAAKAYCESLGGHLAVITSAGEQSAIQTLLSNKGNKDSYWIGGRRDSSGSFKWVTGESFSYTNWGAGEPNNSQEDAIMIFKVEDTTSSSKFGEWNDLSSSGAEGYSRYYGLNNLGFICEWDTVTTSGGNSKLITLTEGNDTYSNSVSGATINALAGKDTIYNSGDSVKIVGGSGNDYIYNDWYTSDLSISGGAGNDSVILYQGKNILIDLDAGNDYVYNTWEGSNITINGGAGNDTIDNHASKLVVSGGAGDDSISLYGGENITVIGGEGNDSIWNGGSKVLFKYTSGDGKDKIAGFNSSSTLSIGGGSYSTTKSGKNIIVTVGTGKITLAGAATLSAVHIKGTKSSSTGKTLSSSGSYTSLVGDSGNDSLYNSYDYVTIVGNSGNDTITNDYGEKVSINGGVGNDSIINDWVSHSSTINGGTGNDTIYNYWGDSLKISGGTGDDYTYLWHYTDRSNKTLIKYSSGDGNDTIEGLDSNDTLSISGGSYSTQASSNDVIVKVGNDTINLKYAYATADTLHINGNAIKLKRKAIKLTSSNNTIESSRDSISIDLGAGNDSIMNDGDNVTIIGGTGNDSIRNSFSSSHSKNTLIKYNTGDGNDIISYFNSDDTLSIGASSYSTKKRGSDIIVTVGTGKITLTGAASLSKVNIKGTKSSSTGKTLSSSSSHTSLVGGSGKDSLYIGHYSVTASGGAGNDTIWSYEGDYAKIYGGNGNDKIYNHQGDYAYMSGGNGDDSIYNKTWYSTVDAGEGNDTITNFHSGYKTSINGGAGNDLISLTSTAAYTHDHTIKGGTGNDTIYGNNAVTNRADGTTYQFSAGDGYDIIYNFTKYDRISLGGGNYKRSTVGSDVIVSMNSGDSMTLKNAKGKTISIVGGTNIDSTEKNSWRLSGTTATYGTASNTLVTVTGVTSTSGLSLNNKVVTVAASSLNKSKVSISGSGYTLKLGSDVTKSSSTSKDWSYSNSTATYKQTKSAYYSLASNAKSITYSKGTTSTLATVSGVKSSSGLTVNNKVVTVAANSLNKSKVTISDDGYKLKLGSDVTKSSSTSKKWSYSNSTATYKQTNSAYYSLASNAKSISYTKATNSTLAKISGVKSRSGISISSKVITVPKSIIGTSKKVSVSGSGYEFNFPTGNYNKTSIAGSSSADKITTRGSKISIGGGKGADTIKVLGSSTTINGGAGNDRISLTSSANNNVIVYSSGNDTIYGFDDNDSIKIKAAAQISTSGDDVIFNIGSGSITVKDAADKTIAYSDSNGATTFSATSDEPYTVNGAGITLSSSYSGENFDVINDIDDGDKIVTINASAVTHGINIIGNAKANKIIGGAGNDTLEGDDKNDSLTGGDGSDVFIYYSGYGDDVITDYAAEDKISIASGEIITVKPSGKDIIFNVGSESIKVRNALRKGITYIDSEDVEHDYKNGEQTVILNEKKTSATITGNYWKDSFDMANFGTKISTVDASPITQNFKVTGNNRANKILGGSGKNTLIGGGGNDTLQGGSKADVFVYNSGDGNDIIVGYGTGDTISITSGTVDYASVKGDTVIFTVGNGKISLEGAIGEKITYYDQSGKTSKYYSNSPSNVWFDTDCEVAPNDLSALVQNNSAAYSLAEVPSTKNNFLPTLTSTKT